jgi:hypothetical protein
LFVLRGAVQCVRGTANDPAPSSVKLMGRIAPDAPLPGLTVLIFQPFAMA